MNRVFEPERFRIDVDQFHRMDEAGIFPPDARVELIDGELLTMAPIGAPHAYAVATLTELVTRSPGRGTAYVMSQSPVILSRFSEPQPDLLVLRGPRETYARRAPGWADVLLLVEVSDSTVRYDRNRKLPLYARSGVQEVWLVDIPARRLETHADPAGVGYRTSHTLMPGEIAVPGALPDMRLDWGEILGPED